MAEGNLVIGLDCSTTAAKAVAWDRNGSPLGGGRKAIALENPSPGAWQQDAEGWWTASCRALAETAGELGTRRSELAALAVTHQRETFVVTDRQGRPLHDALVWMDARCRPQVARAVARLGAGRLHRVSGKPPCTTPSLYKLMFLFDEAAELRGRNPLVHDVHSFLVQRLTGEVVTSLACADPTGMVDMERRAWAPELLDLAGITESQLPTLVEPGDIVGRLTGSAADATGLPVGLPVVAGAGDGQAAGLGTGASTNGRAYLNLGTAIVSGVLHDRYTADPAYRTMYGAAPGTYFLETDLRGGTFTIGWLVDRLLREVTRSPRSAEDLLAELEARASELPPGSEGLVVVPYWNGVMNPHWDDDASGLTLGWRGDHGPHHLHRAILEGIALEQRLHTEGVEAAAGSTVRELVAVGGGSKSDLWCQILADVTGRCVTRAGTAEASALGAGILAAAAAGLHPGLDAAVRAMTRSAESFEPGPNRDAYQRLFEEVYRDLYAALREPMHRLAAMANVR